MGVHCQIHLDRPPEGSYRPGSVVSGAVKYAIDEDTFYKDITVCLRGKGYCYWSEGSGDSNVSYYGYEDYVNVNKSLLDNKTGQRVLVQKGLYSYPFGFELPPNIPSSYKDGYCIIAYYVKLTFEKKGLLKSNKKFRTEIPVVSFVDVTSSQEPIICGERKILKSLTRTDDVINVKVTIKNPSLVPGDKAVLDIEVKNESNTKITTIKTQLMQEITHIAVCGHRHYYFFPIKETKSISESIEGKSTVNLIHSEQIPEGLFSINSKILLKDYKYKIKIKLPFPHKSFFIAVPVIIGEANATNVKKMESERTWEPEPSSDVPPPSYWEVMQEDKSMEEMKKCTEKDIR